MINIFNRHIKLAFLLSAALLFACDEDDPTPQSSVGKEGFFIVNEGAWGHGNASLSYYDRESGEVTNDIFYTANNERDLGDQAQSMTIHDDKGYIVVQNSGTIEVIDIDKFTIVATIDTDITSPRYFVGLDETKGYVSDWEDGFSSSVKVIDLTTYEVTSTISTGSGTNEMMIVDNKLYAVNAGGWGSDKSLSVINTSTDKVEKTIELGDNPNSLEVDAQGNVWVLTSGYTAYDQNWDIDLANSTKGSLIRLNSAGEITLNLTFPEFSSPSHLRVNYPKSTLYFNYNGGIYAMETSATELPATPLIEGYFYGLAVDPINGNIIGCEAPDFTTSGSIKIYNTAGSLQESLTVGIAPNGCTFK